METEAAGKTAFFFSEDLLSTSQEPQQRQHWCGLPGIFTFWTGLPCSLFFTQPVIFSVAGFPQEEIPGWKSHMLHGYYRAFPPSLHTVIIKITFPQVSLCKTSHTNSTAESLNWQTPDSVSNLFPSLYIKILCRNGQHIQCCWNPRVDLPTRNLWAKADV